MVEDTSMYAGVIYGLHNGDFDYRYIGQTVSKLNKRFNHHKHNAKAGKQLPVYDWMRKYGVENIQICVIATFDEDTIHAIDEVEIFHIAQYRDVLLGAGNLNLAHGGDGNRGSSPSAETREKMSLANTGHPVSEETRQKLSAASKGRRVSDETRQKLSKALKGKPKSDETKKKMSASRMGIQFSDETRQRMSDAHKGIPHKGNHTRWHVGRGIVKPGCSFCAE